MSENTVDLTRVEELLGDLAKSITELPATDNSAVEAIAKGADALVAEARESNERLSKSVEAIAEALTQLSAKVDELASTVHGKIEKSLSEIAAQPLPRAVIAVPEVSPNEAAAVVPAPLTKQDVVNKALVELRSAAGDRKMELLSGIARLDSNINPAQVAADLRLL